jgi:RNA polymerase-binding transcription factor DksA
MAGMAAGKTGDSRKAADRSASFTDQQVQAARARLEKRLRELESRLDTIEHDLDEPVAKDFEERATEREGDEVLEGLGASGLAEIRMIRAALGRIEDGVYGDCVACGEPISDERLDAVPHAARCRNCA